MERRGTGRREEEEEREKSREWLPEVVLVVLVLVVLGCEFGAGERPGSPSVSLPPRPMTQKPYVPVPILRWSPHVMVTDSAAVSL